MFIKIYNLQDKRTAASTTAMFFISKTLTDPAPKKNSVRWQ